MTRSYILDRNGDSPLVLPANEDSKIRVFHTFEDAQRADLAEGEIVATDNDTEDSSTIPPNILKYIQDYVDRGPQEVLYTDTFQWQTTTNTPILSWEYDSEYAGTVTANVYLDTKSYTYWRVDINGVTVDASQNSSASYWTTSIQAPVKIGDHIEIYTRKDSSTAVTATVQIIGVKR